MSYVSLLNDSLLEIRLPICISIVILLTKTFLMKEKYVRMAKKMFDENNMDLWEIKVDVWMHRWMKSGRLERFLRFSFVQKILRSSFVTDISHKIRPVLHMIFLVL